MKVVVLGSGSKGNCTYIETKTKKILIDAGLSILQIKNRLAMQGITFTNIDIILVTHEHTDHIKYLASLVTKTNAIICIHKDTYEEANRRLSGGLLNRKIRFIEADKRYSIDELSFVPIKLSHDATNCFGFILKEENGLDSNTTYASITDTGYIPTKYYNILSTISVLLIESNHDVLMQKQSGRPWILINRVLSERGHLSNVECSEILKQIVTPHTKQVIFGHISEECNLESIAVETCLKAFNNNLPFKLHIAKQHEPLDVIEVA